MKRTNQLVFCGLAALGILILSSFPLFAQAPSEPLSASDIWANSKNKQFTPPENSKVSMTMTLVNKKGRKRIRKISWKRKDYGNGEAKSLVSFLAPASVKGTALLTWEHPDQPNDVFLYMPENKRIRRIPPEQNQGRLMGSDLSYSDMVRPDIDEADHWVVSEKEEVDGRACWLIESKPKSGKDTKYGKIISWIDKETLIPHKVEYYNKELVLYRVFKILRTGPVGEGSWPLHFVIENVRKNHKTEVVFEDIQLDQDIPDAEFTRKALQR